MDEAAMREALKNRFFTFLRECGRLLGKDDNQTAELIEDPSWFFCFDDGLTPTEAVRKYQEHLKAGG